MGTIIFLLISVMVFAKTPSNKNIEFCQETIEKDGNTYSLAHSLFHDSLDGKGKGVMLNYQSKFASPITHTYTFSKPIKHKLWLHCNYWNRDFPHIEETVEVPRIPSRCIETMYPGENNRVQYFKCEYKSTDISQPSGN